MAGTKTLKLRSRESRGRPKTANSGPQPASHSASHRSSEDDLREESVISLENPGKGRDNPRIGAMSDYRPNDAYLPFGDVELNDAGDLVGIVLGRSRDDTDACRGGNWRRMADAIVHSPALKKITIWSCYDRSDLNALPTVFGRERTQPCVMEKFFVDGNALGPEGLVVMLPFLKSALEIKQLAFEESDLDDEGVRLLSEVLGHVRVEWLSLWGNTIGGGNLDQLFSANNSSHLHILDLQRNPIGAHGLEAICRFLQRDDTEMRKLYFDYVDKGQFRTVLESISPRSKVLELFNEEGGDVNPDEESTAAKSRMVKNVVCNTDSFEALCESNHQLIWVGGDTHDLLKSDPMLKKAIVINNQLAHGASITSRIRSKLRAFYFQGQFDVQPFIDIGVVFVPFILELVTMTEHVFLVDDDEFSEVGAEIWVGGGKCATVVQGDLGSVYHLIRNYHLPELLCFPSPESKIQKYENRILSLEEENAKLTAEIEELRSQFGYPSKRAKTSSDRMQIL